MDKHSKWTDTGHISTPDGHSRCMDTADGHSWQTLQMNREIYLWMDTPDQAQAGALLYSLYTGKFASPISTLMNSAMDGWGQDISSSSSFFWAPCRLPGPPLWAPQALLWAPWAPRAPTLYVGCVGLIWALVCVCVFVCVNNECIHCLSVHC